MIERVNTPDGPMAFELYTPTADGEVVALIHANNIQQVQSESVLVYTHARQHPSTISILNSFYEHCGIQFSPLMEHLVGD